MKNTIPRRQFLKSGSLTLLGSLGLPYLSTIKVYHIPLHDASIQGLFAKDPQKALANLAAVGFKELEYSGQTNQTYYGLKPAEFRKQLDDSPIRIPISQTAFKTSHWLENKKDVSDEWKQLIENSLTIGQEYCISPTFDWDLKDSEAITRSIEAYNLAGEITEKAGLRLGFRPSASLFEIQYLGQPVYDYLLQHMEPKYVCQQLDLGVLAKINQDPMHWLRRFPHHFESLHIQDASNNGQSPEVLGEGTLPLDDLLTFARKNLPIKYWVIKPVIGGDVVPWKALGNDLQRFKQYGFV